MSTKILKLVLIKSYREAYYQLSPEGRNRLWDKVGAHEIQVEATSLLYCNSRWCNEAGMVWGVMEYPSIQALQKLTELHEQNDIWRYMEAETILGTSMDENEQLEINLPDPVYQLFLIKNVNNDTWEALTQDTRDRIFGAVVASIEKNGGKPWRRVSGYANWSNEEYAAWGVTVWPSLEAEQAHYQDLQKIGWHRYIYAKTILGKKI